jgi:hypothetical protein
VSEPADALRELAAALREDGSVISPHVVEPTEEPVLGLLAAAGPRAAEAPAEYAFVVEAVREGYLLHYGLPRLMRGQDADLALLAGDYLYALGLSRLSKLDDQEAVRELSDLISACAKLHAEHGDDPETAQKLAAKAWLGAVARIAGGESGELQDAMARAAEAVGFAPD